jgi:hypothetical protein
MERNVESVQQNEALREGARELVARAVEHATLLLGTGHAATTTPRGGRKACPTGTPSSPRL